LHLRRSGFIDLVVANQTLGGDQLLEQLRERMEAGPCHFHVLVPATPVDQLSRLGSRDPTKGGSKARRRGWVGRPRQRLHHERLRLPGGAEVHGEVGEPDPVAAIKEVFGSHQVDEIILSTLPQRRSGWLARDLPGRVRRALGRAFGLSVTPVVARRPGCSTP
jgi:hypothetical protein